MIPNGKSRHMTCFAQDCRSVENLPKNTPTILRMEREEIPCFYRSRTATDVKSPLNCRIQSNRPPVGTKVETFSVEVVEKNRDKILYVDSLLQHYPSYEKGTLLTESQELASKDSLSVVLPEGTNAVRLLSVNIQVDSAHYEQAMREQIIKMDFDGLDTVIHPMREF